MRRVRLTPRAEWRSLVERDGLSYHTLADGSPYWDESAYWEFSAREIDRLEAATAEIQRLALEAGEAILAQGRLGEMRIPEEAAGAIRAAWNAEPPALYGRLDLAFDGHAIKLLEYNADTPTALLEAAVIQWRWLQERFPEADQFNSIHEKLVAKWRDLAPYLPEVTHFADAGVEEDSRTVLYLRDTAEQAGVQTEALAMHEIGWDEARGIFTDLSEQPIRALFKLYPWEWMLHEPFARQALATMPPHSALVGYGPAADRRFWGSTLWIEPIWKMLWSNKALLAILWELNPGHELLLPAYLDGPHGMSSYVRKPFFGREGQGIVVVKDGRTVAGALTRECGDCVYQELAQMATADGRTVVLGSWLVDGEPAGVGVRESAGLVTGNESSFMPHLFR